MPNKKHVDVLKRKQNRNNILLLFYLYFIACLCLCGQPYVHITVYRPTDSVQLWANFTRMLQHCCAACSCDISLCHVCVID